MRQVVNELLHSCYNNNKLLEAFNAIHNGGAIPNPKALIEKNPFLVLFSFIIIEILVLCFGKWLWNNIVVQLVSGVRPAKDIWQILGFSILIKLLTN